MKPEVKKLWLEALRSGEYRQADGVLKGEGGMYGREGTCHCCLGVLTQLYANENNLEFTGEGSFLKPPVLVGDINSQEILCSEVKAWAGLRDNNPSVRAEEWDEETGEYYRPIKALSEINDAGTSFSKIADLIEAQL